MILFPAMMVGGHLLIAVVDKVPDLNFGPICRESGPDNLAGKDDIQTCLKDEGAARDALAKQWSTFKPADRARCIRLSTTNGNASYVEVLTCLELDRDAKTRHPKRDAAIDAPEPGPAPAGEMIGTPVPGVQMARQPGSAAQLPPPLPLEPQPAPTSRLQEIFCLPGLKAILPACLPAAGNR
jgi:hypothetical protein